MASFANHDFGGSESEDEDFNPAPAVDSDNEEETHSKANNKSSNREDEENDNEDEGSSPPKSKQQDRKKSQDDETDGLNDANGDNEGEEDEEDAEGGEDDEEDEEDDDEEDEVTGHPRKRRRRDARLQFIDVEAEVDDEDEEDLDEDEDLPDEMHPDDLVDMPAGAETDDRRHRELDRKRDLEANLDAEKQAALLKERYGRNRTTRNADSAMVSQSLLVPTVDDPSIWAVKCKPGKEREVVMSIMKRFEDRINTRDPLGIHSAFERGGTAMIGHVYVEARKREDVIAACDGIQNAYVRPNAPVLIQVGEMTSLLKTTASKTLEPGMYVRIKRGKYEGDLAAVDAVESNGLEVTLRIVPRLDYGNNEDPGALILDASGKRKRLPPKSTKANRPPARLFSETEAKKRHGRILSLGTGTLGKKVWNYGPDTYVDGFLVKDFKINHLQTENVNPTLEEVTKFASSNEEGTDNLDLAALAATIRETSTAVEFLPGDMVEIFQGEQQGVCGKAIGVHNQVVTLRVSEGEMKGQIIEAPVKALRKLFRDGDHVKVIGGSKYTDEVGMVIKVKDDRVTLLTDSNNQEITVFARDLRTASDSGAAINSSKYDLYDLVQLDASTVACVIKVDRDSLRVLDQNDTVRSLLPSNISNRIERRRHAVATDRDGSEIRNDDTVKENYGEGRSGRVLHIHRNFLFIQNRTQTENAGLFVVRSSNVTTVAAKGGKVNSAGPDLSKMNPAFQRGNAANGNAMGPPKLMGRDRLLGKTVTVRKGPYKGLLGIVKDSSDESARVELHGKNKIISVSRESLAIKDPITGQNVSVGFGAGRGRPGAVGGRFGAGTPRASDGFAGGRTPMAPPSGGRTPAWNQQAGGRTPAAAMHGGRTPAWHQQASSARTPAWGHADGNRTTYGGSGSQTAYGGGGSSTWNPNSRTPFHGSHGTSSGGSGDAYTGPKTPAWHAPTPSSSHSHNLGSRTPAYHANSASSAPISAPTPGATPGAAFDAPTPGFGAPTPGDTSDRPTPRGYGGYGGVYSTPAAAPTPGAFPDTPGYGMPETPAAVVDEDPRIVGFLAGYGGWGEGTRGEGEWFEWHRSAWDDMVLWAFHI
ncbi:transcription elongation factor Spt5 [Patellaria atrata CBS 101060]|uniref:Transcription elongation factor SPT5 n=1 Tax=Patellaria atrata CBS 101060 TaxID=1346257 RepID=A0A9P4SES7_9PEZI|nr:transcription elongation factor Spt5 [Patellaria atrata CBS 101060]